MKNLKALIVDDEKMAIKLVEQIITKYFDNFQSISKAENIEKAIEIINKEQPDIIFLDIEMPHGSGFDLLDCFPNYDFKVIFITAYDQFAINAFKQNAVDYLLKPISDMDLVKATNKAIEQIKLKKFYTESNNAQLKNDILNRQSTIVEFTSLDCIEYVDTKEIIRCEASGNYTSIYLEKDKKLFISKLLSEVEELISLPLFYRSHKSHLINLRHISKYVKSEGGYIVMSDGGNVPLSRKKKTEFLEIMHKIN